MNFVEELKWRGMLQDIIPGTEDFLNENKTAAYIGFDPTAESLHVGSLATIMLLVHFQKAGHKPIALVGGATGMVGDPSFKGDERSLLDEDTLNKYVAGIHKQLQFILDKTSDGNTEFELVNNYDWMKDFSFLNFIRDIGKHISVNYMSAKDSVKKRLETGISFTEFSYQLLQGYDFLWLYENKNCKLQMGGSDQWGNITTGTELIRRKAQGKAFALTTPLITKSDGSKFGKSEGGNVWLDKNLTSPYKFYQFWMNTSDAEAEKYIKVFTLLDKATIDKLVEAHKAEPHKRLLQNTLANEVTTLVHNQNALDNAIAASGVLFSKNFKKDFEKLSEQDIKDIFEGVPTFKVAKNEIDSEIEMIEFLASNTQILKSKGEARRSLKENSISINKQKVNDAYKISSNDILKDKFIIVQKGKKNKFLVEVV